MGKHSTVKVNWIFSKIQLKIKKFIRLRRSNSDLSNFLSESRTLISNLVNRGYNLNDLLRLKLIFCDIPRNSIIPYKNKTLTKKNYDNSCLKFIINHDINYLSLKPDF